MNRQINWDNSELHKRFPEKWYKTMQGVRQVTSLMGVKDESEVQRILFAAQSEAKRRGRVEICVSGSDTAITDRRGMREAGESSRSVRHTRGELSPEKKRSSQTKEKCHHPYTTISGG